MPVGDDEGVAIQEQSSSVYGEVFTRRWVVDALLDLLGYVPSRPLHELTLVEPSVGSGAFLGPVIERLIASARLHGVGLHELAPAIRAMDLQPSHVEVCTKLATTMLHDAGVSHDEAKQIAQSWLRTADYLLNAESLAADFVVGNPPYIRTEDLDDATEAAYRRRWPTMRGRADIYVGFYERSLAILNPGGKIGFICADRWMRNAYGANLRELISQRYCVETLWQMHDVDAFESEVSAYPAITVLANRSQTSVVVVDTDKDFGAEDAATVARFVASNETHLAGESYVAHRMEGWFEGRDLWPAGDPKRIAMLEDLNERFPVLEDVSTGTRIGIGVATGADKAYIANKDVDVESDRKLPLTTTDDIRSGVFRWGERVLLNPWSDGKLVDLGDYPKLREALAAHPAIKQRYVARKDPRGWYKTIDKINPSLTGRPKLLLQDMKSSIQPVFEAGGHYPHHNLYYIVSDDWDLRVLGGILLSRVAQAFIEAYGVRMRGGTLRFQAQYLRKIRVPKPDEISADVKQRLADAFERRDVDAATRAAECAYGLQEGVL